MPPRKLASLPVDRVEPTPYQRDLSETHVKRLMGVVEKIGIFLDPIIVIHRAKGYWTPNGNHRLQALKKLGYRAVTALVVPDADVAFKILALNTEKAHNLREKSLETIRMARALATEGDGNEASYAFEFERPSCQIPVFRSFGEKPAPGRKHPVDPELLALDPVPDPGSNRRVGARRL